MKLQLKRSNVLDNGKAKEPTPPYVEYGELCVNYNTNDPALFIKDSNDTIIRIAGRGAVGEGGNPSGPSLPDSGNSIGDVFFNTGDLTLYYWDGTDWVPIANQTNAADIFVGTFAEVDVEIPVAKRQNGLLLWETEEGNLFLWYIDADTSQWVVAVPGGGSGGGGGGGGGANVTVLAVAPNNPEQGDLWYCTDDGRLYIYYQDVNTSQWVDASPDNLSEGFWERDGGVLKPIVSGDDVDLGTGDLSANNTVFSGLSHQFGLTPDQAGNLAITTAGFGGGQYLITMQSGSDIANECRSGIRFGGCSGNHSAGILGGHTTAGQTILEFQTDDFAGGAKNLKTKAVLDYDGAFKVGGTYASPKIQLYSTGSASFYPSTIDDTTRVRIIYSGSNQQASIAIEGDGHISSNAFTVKGGGQDKVLIRHDGSALFKGAVQTGGGVVTPSAIIQTGADDPANYTTTMEDGEEQQVYSGPTLDVKEKLLDFVARIEALEAEVQQLKGGN